MGIIVDEEIAKRSPCTCHKIGPTDNPEDLICFSPGIIGALTNVQDREYCPSKLIVKEDRIRERVEKFRAASETCEIETEKYPKGQRLLPRIQCMSRELKKRSIEI